MERVVKAFEERRILPTEELLDRIQRLKEELNAVILAHNYQWGEVQDVADFVGDSLELSRRAMGVEGDAIVFCAVDFMAETAAILNPARTVLLPEKSACCPMAAMIDAPRVRQLREEYPKAAIVCYVNTSAAVKAESDICCTSANAIKVVEAVEEEEVVLIPDENLGRYVASETAKVVHTYPGYCITHHILRAEDVVAAKELHPEAAVVVHPECRMEVIELADAVCSTSQMLRFVRESECRTFLIGTEFGLLHRLRKENPNKEFFILSSRLVCPNMKKTNLGSLLRAMEERKYQVSVPEEVRVPARRALDRMLRLG